MITIHHLEQSRSESIIWLCEELALEYELRRYFRDSNFVPPPEFYALHPIARAPVVSDGGVMLIESGAIIDYLIDRYGAGGLKPDVSSPDFPLYVQFLHFAEATAMADFVMAWRTRRSGDNATDPLSATINRRLQMDIEFLEQSIERTPFFGGQAFSGADIAIAFFIKSARDSALLDPASCPHLANYMARIEERPAFRKAMAIAQAPKDND